jgi:hypothetical protein
METTTSKIPGFIRITCDKNHYLHRVGSKEYPEIHDVTVPEALAAEWEEIPLADVPKYTEAEYSAKTVELIRRKYSQDDEIAILRKFAALSLATPAGLTAEQIDDHARHAEAVIAELHEYNDYAEACKAEAREILSQPRDATQEGGEA